MKLMSRRVHASRRKIVNRHDRVLAARLLSELSVHVNLEAAAVSYSNTPGGNFAPTLVIDAHGAAAQQLAEQLTHGGFAADSADTCAEALAAVGAQHYCSMIFLGDLGDPEDVQCIAELRQRAQRTWIVMISSTELRDRRVLYLRYGVDAQIVTPFSMQDLVSRLMACTSVRPIKSRLGFATGAAQVWTRGEQTLRLCAGSWAGSSHA
jgi:CheY-like chemotaxis protein